MSVQVNQYIIYGIKLPYSIIDKWVEEKGEDWWGVTQSAYAEDSAFSSKIGGKDGIFMLVDGMNGKYIYIGEVLKKTTDDDPMLENTEIPDTTLTRAMEMIDKIKEIVGETNQVPMWHVITHYS